MSTSTSRSPLASVEERLHAAIGSFAMRYADQTVDDHASLTQAILDGRVSAIDELA